MYKKEDYERTIRILKKLNLCVPAKLKIYVNLKNIVDDLANDVGYATIILKYNLNSKTVFSGVFKQATGISVKEAKEIGDKDVYEAIN